MSGPSEIDDLHARLALFEASNKELAKLNAALVTKVETLEGLVLRLTEELSRNSKNSNKPPSGDTPGGGKLRKNAKGKKRGGQKGHKGSYRELVPPEQVARFIHMFPARCDACHEGLPRTKCRSPHRHQQTELEPFVPRVTEWQRHEVACSACGHTTLAHYDDDVIPKYAFGPRAMAVIAMLTGVYHLGRRATTNLLFELLGLRISTGSVSNIERRMSAAVKPAVDEAWETAQAAPVKHTDGTTWLRAGVMLSLWTVATAGVTVFKVLADGQRETLEREILPEQNGILVSDRATALKFWAMHLRQVCWAHLLRKFVSFSERDGPMRTIGRELRDATTILFAYWHDLREGRLTREQFAARVAPLRADFERTLRRGIDADIKGLSGSCADLWEHREALWTFVDVDGVEPTNNHAERELRRFVLWRKRSFGTQSDRGDRFAERLMTIAHTARKQGRDVLDFLVACATRYIDGDADEPAPSLFVTA
ncbi:MAG: IS66 family transposase [Polyangiales bacterium]